MNWRGWGLGGIIVIRWYIVYSIDTWRREWERWEGRQWGQMLRQQCKQKMFFSFFLWFWWTPQPPKNVSAINLSRHAGFSFIFILMSPPPPHPPDDDDVVVVVPIMSLTIMNEYQYESIFISLASLVLLWSLTYFSLSLSLWWWWMMNDDMMDGYLWVEASASLLLC